MAIVLGFCRGTAITVCKCTRTCLFVLRHWLMISWAWQVWNLQGWPAGWRPRQSVCSESEGPLQGTSLLPDHSSLFPLKAFN